MDNNEQIQIEIELLQHQLAALDLLTQSGRNEKGLELTILKMKNLKLKIDPNTNHRRPHFHVDYGHEISSVSISIDTGEVLAGKLPNKYLKLVTIWADRNRTAMLNIWNSLREHKDISPFLADLKPNP